MRKQEENLRATMEENTKNIKTISDNYYNLTRSYRHFKKLEDQYKNITAISKKAQKLGERSHLDLLELEKDALAVEREVKVTEQTLAVYEAQLALEMDYNQFVREYDGNRACSY
jgi:outer membrane protein TolC